MRSCAVKGDALDRHKQGKQWCKMDTQKKREAEKGPRVGVACSKFKQRADAEKSGSDWGRNRHLYPHTDGYFSGSLIV